MNDFHGTENEFTLDGVTYIAKASGSCADCAFYLTECANLNTPRCTSARKDGRTVNFIRKPTTSDSQATMTYPPTNPKVAKSLDFSRPVQLRDGTPVRILCTDSGIPNYPVVGITDGRVHIWTLDGRFDINSYLGESDLDLVQTSHPRKHAELIKRWADDDSMRIKGKFGTGNWHELYRTSFNQDWDYEEILPGDPLY